jgi:hypothetical protein
LYTKSVLGIKLLLNQCLTSKIKKFINALHQNQKPNQCLLSKSFSKLVLGIKSANVLDINSIHQISALQQNHMPNQCLTLTYTSTWHQNYILNQCLVAKSYTKAVLDIKILNLIFTRHQNHTLNQCLAAKKSYI